MKLLNLKEWKDELKEAELAGIDSILMSTAQLSKFIQEVENLRKKVADHETYNIKW